MERHSISTADLRTFIASVCLVAMVSCQAQPSMELSFHPDITTMAVAVQQGYYSHAKQLLRHRPAVELTDEEVKILSGTDVRELGSQVQEFNDKSWASEDPKPAKRIRILDCKWYLLKAKRSTGLAGGFFIKQKGSEVEVACSSALDGNKRYAEKTCYVITPLPQPPEKISAGVYLPPL